MAKNMNDNPSIRETPTWPCRLTSARPAPGVATTNAYTQRVFLSARTTTPPRMATPAMLSQPIKGSGPMFCTCSFLVLHSPLG